MGYKAGLALTREEIAAHLPDAPDFRDVLLAVEDQWVRVRSEDYESVVNKLLHRVGNIPTADPLPPVTTVYRRFGHDPTYSEIIEEVLSRSMELLESQVGNSPQGTPLDPAHLIGTVATEFGPSGVDIVVALIDSLAIQLHTSPWGSGRLFDWDDTVELGDLFLSESLDTQYGTFFDQRFVDYLSQNFDSIDKINWRKFEGLVGEFFERVGFRVKIGPGRGDGGVDIRVWDPEDDVEKPPLLLVQCKRQLEKVNQVVVKALWTDVSYEEAQLGLIVTTSALAPSADAVRKARGYRVSAVERPMLQNWIRQLRAPGTGTFMA